MYGVIITDPNPNSKTRGNEIQQYKHQIAKDILEKC